MKKRFLCFLVMLVMTLEMIVGATPALAASNDEAQLGVKHSITTKISNSAMSLPSTTVSVIDSTVALLVAKKVKNKVTDNYGSFTTFMTVATFLTSVQDLVINKLTGSNGIKVTTKLIYAKKENIKEGYTWYGWKPYSWSFGTY